MALVAYGSSGESSDSEDESPPSQQQQLLTAKSVISNGAAGGGSGTSNAASTISGSISKVADFNISDDEDEFNHNGTNDLFDDKAEGPDIMTLISKKLPHAKINALSRGFVDKNEDVSDMVKKVDYGTKLEEPPAKKKKKDGPVKISIPSLKDLKDAEDDAPRPPRPTASKSGSGLFALLPEPQNKTTRRPINTAIPESGGEDIRIKDVAAGSNNLKPTGARRSGLVPHIIAQPKAAASPPPSKAGGSAGTAAAAKIMPVDDSDSDGEDLLGINSGSYFPEESQHVTEQQQTKTFFGQKLPPAPMLPGVAKRPPAPILPPVQDFVSFQPQDDEELGPAVAPYPPNQQVAALPEASVVDNQAAIERLAGKAAKRREFDDMKIIDINEADMRGDPNVWLTKALSEEKAPAPDRKGAVKGLAKHKHQITYLAHQAKERDFELRQEWAQAKANKQASMNKYGFC